MQGIKKFIPTNEKLELLNALSAVGYPVIDFGSFVSPKAVPQMKDTKELLELLDSGKSNSRLLAIVANLRGAQEAAGYKAVDIIGYPLSVSETFQVKNSNKHIVESLEELVQLKGLTDQKGKELVVYLSMAFGNPYGDPYSIEIVEQFAGVLISLGVKTIAISDTVGLATPEEVSNIYSRLSNLDSTITWGLHLHARPEHAEEKIKAAIAAGCRRLDGAILGYGGCPMANDELVGNINTRTIINVCDSLGLEHGLDSTKFTTAEAIANRVFN